MDTITTDSGKVFWRYTTRKVRTLAWLVKKSVVSTNKSAAMELSCTVKCYAIGLSYPQEYSANLCTVGAIDAILKYSLCTQRFMFVQLSFNPIHDAPSPNLEHRVWG